MAYLDFVWTEQTVRHLAEHGISQDDFEYAVCHPVSKGFSRSTGLPTVWGHTVDGRYIMAVYQQIDRLTVLPVTAYEVPEPK